MVSLSKVSEDTALKNLYLRYIFKVSSPTLPNVHTWQQQLINHASYLLAPLLVERGHGGLADLLEVGDGGLAHGAADVVQDLPQLHHAHVALGALGHLDGEMGQFYRVTIRVDSNLTLT